MSQSSDFHDNDDGVDNPNNPSAPGSYTPGSFPQGSNVPGGPFTQQGGFSQAPQSNPFSADLKGDFTSNFGTGTNAVSQIFKEGGFVGDNRSKILIGILLFLAVIGGILLFTTEDEYSDEELVAEEEIADDKAKKEEPKDAAADKVKGTEAGKDEKKDGTEATTAEKPAESLPSPVEKPVATPAPVAAAAGSFMPRASHAPQLSAPAEGAVRVYDETSSDAEFSWTGGGGWILFSRSQSMRPVDFRLRASGNSFTFRRPYPGTWYWQVKNSAGASEVRSFRIDAPAKRQVALSSPSEGGTLTGHGGVVAWSGDHKVAYYRVEISNSGWANPMYRFATSATQIQLQSVPAGPYQLRLGAFSEVAGRWEYTQPINVTIQ